MICVHDVYTNKYESSYFTLDYDHGQCAYNLWIKQVHSVAYCCREWLKDMTKQQELHIFLHSTASRESVVIAET